MKKILYLITEASYFCSHRLDLAAFMQKSGYIVGIATKCSSINYKNMILSYGLELFELKYLHRSNILNPFREILAFKELYTIYKQFNPDLVHHVALKPVIYGTIIAKLLRIKKIINALGGLGFVFTEFNYYFHKKSIFNFINRLFMKLKQKLLQPIIYKTFKIIFKNSVLLLQNYDDLLLLQTNIKINNIQNKLIIIPGSGIQLEKYYNSKPLTKKDFNGNTIKIVLLSRLLWTKGINEFVAAAKEVKNYVNNNNLKINVEFLVYGDLDPVNPAAITLTNLQTWESQNLINYKYFAHDVVAVYKNAHIIVLPSYREGLPKSLLEAAACARPIITTDVPGCRDVVLDGVTGYLIPKQNSGLLALAILKLIQNPKLMAKMGKLGRERVLKKFSTQVIFPKILEMYMY